jgi:hypothetical protein
MPRDRLRAVAQSAFDLECFICSNHACHKEEFIKCIHL